MHYPYKQSADAFAIQTQALASFQAPIRIEDVHCPISMLTGANDVLMSPAMLERFCAEHPQIRHTIISDAAHAIHWENSDEVATFVLNALT
jgi:pimeloyl-ACP methyl ester carboxylesterase